MNTDRSSIIECLAKDGQEVVVCGWVLNVRLHGKIAFLDLRDRTGVLQIGGFSEEVVSVMSTLSSQDVVKITGIIKKREERYINPSLITGTIELEAKKVEIESKAEEMPFDMGGKTLNLELPTLLDYRSLTLRHPSVSSIFKVQEALVSSFRETAEMLGCTEIFVPTIAASSTEGGAEVFKVQYYEHNAFLTQSPQLYKQMMVPVFERVYTIAHAYRAEPSVTTRHLAENTQMDCEFGFVDFNELLNLLEAVVVGILKGAEQKCADILEQRKAEPVSYGTIPRLTLREAQEIIYKEYGRDVRGEKDLSPQDEVDISAWALKNHKSDLVTIHHFPTFKRAFYTMPDPEDPEYSLSYDILFRGIEISSGSQRISNYEDLYNAIKSRGMNPESFSMYLMAFKYGMPSEGGFSFGLERITMKLLGLSNVREASLYPRDMERIDERLTKI